MLGVSQAATIGLHFQVDWSTSAPHYTGFQVTATAFGVPVSGWENLTPLPTGYSNPSSPGPYTLTETIDTTTSGGGLHPLPNGSLSLTWSATAAYTSGFGDASNGGSYGGNHPHRGDQEVLYGFLRDDVFIYTQPNNTIPYSVQVTGLKSLFTNSPYVIQLMATTDSGTAFTNAIVTSASGSQKLNYTATRSGLGILGGISSVSTPLTDDSITISGAPAYKGGTTNDLASTIAGFILTDKPVITVPAGPPAAALAEGASVTLNVAAIGVPPLNYQWRLNGQPINGATTPAYSIPSLSLANSGFYDVVVSNAYGAATNDPVAVSGDILMSAQSGLLADTKTQGTPHAAWSLGAAWQGQYSGQQGVEAFNAYGQSQIQIPGETDFDSSTGTIVFWMNSAGAVTDFGYQGAILLERGRGAFRLDEADDNTSSPGSVEVNAGDNSLTSNADVSDGNWHQVAVSYDQSDSGALNLYIDGVLDNQASFVNAWTWPVGEPFNLGWINDAYWEFFNGWIDDVRIYNRVLSDSEIASVFATGALVDTTALQLRLSFDGPPSSGVALYWSNGGSLQWGVTPGGPFTTVPATSSPWGLIPPVPVQFFRTQL